MALKDLLVHVDNDPACSSRVDVAAALAATYEAHLTGLHPMGWPRLPGYFTCWFWHGLISTGCRYTCKTYGNNL